MMGGKTLLFVMKLFGTITPIPNPLFPSIRVPSLFPPSAALLYDETADHSFYPFNPRLLYRQIQNLADHPALTIICSEVSDSYLQNDRRMNLLSWSSLPMTIERYPNMMFAFET
jgi:hypothetical protein